MKLQEYQSKRILSRYEIPIPHGEVASTPDDARRIASRLGGRVVIKAQVLASGRGKAGGIKLANSEGQAETTASQILGLEIEGQRVNKVLVDEAVDIGREIYLGIALDQQARRLALLTSAERSASMAETAYAAPEKVLRAHINPSLGLQSFQCRELAFSIGLERGLVDDFVKVSLGLYKACIDWDALLVELNPLVITDENKLMAIDGKIILDDNALFRHSELAEIRDLVEADHSEIEARRFKMNYVRLKGDIGCLANGAGLTMATMDIVKWCGGQPASFLDIGEDAAPERIVAALQLMLSDYNVRAILINIIDHVNQSNSDAPDVWHALCQVRLDRPVIAHLVGEHSGPARSRLANANLLAADNLLEAAHMAVRSARLFDEQVDM